jgi:hypothetical protein
MATAVNSSAQPIYLTCKEDTSLDKVSSLSRKSTLWKIAAAVSAVAFIALSIVAFVFVSLHFPEYAPMAGLAIFTLAMPAVNVVQNLLSYSKDADVLANRHKMIHDHNNYFKGLALPAFSTLLNQKLLPGAPAATLPQDAATYSAILAHEKYHDDLHTQLLNEKAKFVASAKTVAAAPATSETRTQTAELRQSALYFEEMALVNKVQSAFYRAALSMPQFPGTLNDLATSVQVSFYERILAEGVDDPTGAENFLKFKDNTFLSFKDVKEQTVQVISQRIFAQMQK